MLSIKLVCFKLTKTRYSGIAKAQGRYYNLLVTDQDHNHFKLLTEVTVRFLPN